MIRALLLGFAGVAMLSTVALAATFDGSPAAPAPFTQLNQAAFDVAVHSRDSGTWYALEPVHAEHGPACEGPTVTHMVTAYEDAVFNCRDHVMTSLNASGYGPCSPRSRWR